MTDSRLIIEAADILDEGLKDTIAAGAKKAKDIGSTIWKAILGAIATVKKLLGQAKEWASSTRLVKYLKGKINKHKYVKSAKRSNKETGEGYDNYADAYAEYNDEEDDSDNTNSGSHKVSRSVNKVNNPELSAKGKAAQANWKKSSERVVKGENRRDFISRLKDGTMEVSAFVLTSESQTEAEKLLTSAQKQVKLMSEYMNEVNSEVSKGDIKNYRQLDSYMDGSNPKNMTAFKTMDKGAEEVNAKINAISEATKERKTVSYYQLINIRNSIYKKFVEGLGKYKSKMDAIENDVKKAMNAASSMNVRSVGMTGSAPAERASARDSIGEYKNQFNTLGNSVIKCIKVFQETVGTTMRDVGKMDHDIITMAYASEYYGDGMFSVDSKQMFQFK